MEFVFIWLLFGIFSAILASYKNRSSLGWFLVGCLFGPFGLLVVAFPKLQDVPTMNHSSTITDGYSMPPAALDYNVSLLIEKSTGGDAIAQRLNISKEKVREVARRLRSENEISEKQFDWTLNTITEEVTIPETKICPFCAEEVKFAAVKCKHCGSDLSPKTVSHATPFNPEHFDEIKSVIKRGHTALKISIDSGISQEEAKKRIIGLYQHGEITQAECEVALGRELTSSEII